ncbi:MAG: Proline/betaine transporter [Wolbachia endosymbiont of Ctenocephalides orientis wCori]|nr:MAG: Proline/betaine transporter [Wolbachia endosymbiont of Ctenocephalides orientis wCori]
MENSKIKKVIISNMFCKLLLWYDFMIFLDLTNMIGRAFFPAGDNLYKLFGIFAIGFFARPFGACIFGYIGDRYGRKVSLLTSILLISLPSGLIGLIPEYDKIGTLASILITLFRILQGIAFGAEKGASIYLLEHSTDRKNLGAFYSITSFGKPIGMILCSIIIIICKKTTDFNAWGWKIPFFFSLFLGAVCIYTRSLIEETIAYKTHEKKKTLSISPLLEVFRDHKRALILSFIISIAANVSIYFAIFYRIFTKEIVSIETYANTYIYEIMLIITSVLTKLSSIIFGVISDRIGREKVVIPCLIILMLMCCPMLSIAYHYKNYFIIMLLYLVFAIVKTGTMSISLTLYELFPTKVRFSGVSLSRSLASAFFGGTTPYVCMWLTTTFIQVNFVAGFYVILCLLISIIAILQIKADDRKVDW